MRAVSLAPLLVLLGALPTWSVRAGAPPPPSLCYDDAGRAPVVGPGREADVEALFRPYSSAAPMGDAAPGCVFRSLEIQGDTIRAELLGPGGQVATLTLRPDVCELPPDAARRTASFVMAGEPSLRAPCVAPLAAAVVRNDRGGFWTTWVEVGGGPGRHDEPSDEPSGPPWSLNESVGGIALLLALAALALLADLPRTARSLIFGRPGGGRVALALLGLTLAGAGLRFGLPPTFIREAYPLQTNPYAAFDGICRGTLRAYPNGPEVLAGVWAWAFGGAPYDVWFSLHAALGALTVPLAYVPAAVLTRSRGAGLAAAATLCFLPQHVRLSASESVHVTLVFWGTVAVGWAALAARDGRLGSFAVAALAAGAVVVSRPEGALLGPTLLIIAWSRPGSGVRRHLASPARVALLAAIAWLLAPVAAAITTSASIAHFTPGSTTGEGLRWETLSRLVALALWPDGHNGLFDAATSPLWIWPLTLWGAATLWRRGGRRGAVGLVLGLLTFLALYAGMEPSVTIWKMARYHASLLPVAVPLTGLGLWDALGRAGRRWPRLRAPGPRLGGALAVPALGLVAWWPAMVALPRDWQRDLHWALALGASEASLASPDTRVVLPDNRRRFLDLTPRKLIEPLTQGHQPLSMSVPVSEALASLHAHGDETPAVYYEGLYCWLARGPGEDMNPQCQAMHEGFELVPLRTTRVDEPAYLSAYATVRPAGPLTLTLYRVGRRLSGAGAALAGLPAPLTGRLARPPVPVMGSGTGAYLDPAVPPLGASPGAARFCGWEAHDHAAPGPCPGREEAGRGGDSGWRW